MSFSTFSIGEQHNAITLAVLFVVLWSIGSFLSSAYNVYFGPLSKYPGPKLRAWSVWPKVLAIWRGDDRAIYPKLHAEYGPVVRIAPNELSFIGGARVFKDIYGFRKSGELAPFKDPVFMGKPLNNVHNIFTAGDANHSRQRKILSHAFADKALKELEPLLKYWAGFMIQKLHERATTCEKADVLRYYNYTTFDIMADLCFNESLHMLENDEYSPWVTIIFKGFKQMAPFSAARWLGRPIQYLVDDVLLQTKTARSAARKQWQANAERVDKRMLRTPERIDLWTAILAKSKGPDALTLSEHYSNATSFMVAGTETSATALSGTTYHLLQNPRTMARLINEIRRAFPDLESMTMEGLGHLKYLHAVIQEGLRMYPPVPTALPRRTPNGGIRVGDDFIPANVTVGVHHLATYRDETNFKDAHEFHPERWLGDPLYKDDNLHALEPFSVGPRACIGKNLAWHEMRMILAATLLHFDLQLCDESKDWLNQKTYILWEKKPLICTLTPVRM